MTNEQRATVLRTAVLEWQKKYGIQDGDPLLASIELFRIYIGSFYSETQGGAYFPSFDEFRDSLELLDERSKNFARHAAELTEALHLVPNIKKQLSSYHSSALVLIALCFLVTGLLIGKCFL